MKKKFFRHLFSFFSVLFLSCQLSAFSSHPPQLHKVQSALGLEMIWIEGGVSFLKGSPPSESNRYEDENQHTVTLSQGFFLGKYEVSQEEYYEILREPGLIDSPRKPIGNLSWDEAFVFVEKLNDLEKTARNIPEDWHYTLPSEAEWEYACRAGTESAFSFGENIDITQANFSSSQTNINELSELGESGPPNDFGFYDMHGNVREWCLDWYAENLSGFYSDPSGPIYVKDRSGAYRDSAQYFFYDEDIPQAPFSPQRVARGGSFRDSAEDLRSARRFPVPPEQNGWADIGLRLALKKIEPDITLEYATTGSQVTTILGENYQVESTWEDNGKSKVYYIRGQDLITLLDNAQTPENEIPYRVEILSKDEIYEVAFKVGYSAELSDLNRVVQMESGSGSMVPVPGFGYSIHLCNGIDTDGDWYSSDPLAWIRSEKLAENLKKFDPDLAGYTSSSLFEDNSPYDLQPTSSAMVSLRNHYLRDTYSEFLNEAPGIGNGWRHAKWFGYYFSARYPWIFHENLGWTYIFQTQSDSAWIFRKYLGWGWTSSPDWWFKLDAGKYTDTNQTASFPYIHRQGYDANDTKRWTYLNTLSSKTMLYDFQEDDWFDLDQSIDINGTIVPQLGGSVSGYGQYNRWEKVTLTANPSKNYKFLYWGNNQNKNASYEFFATKSQKMHASFSPTLSGSSNSQNTEQIFADILSIRDDLDGTEKSRALFEFLFTGKSPTAGVK